MHTIRTDKPDLVIIPDAGTNDFVEAQELRDLEIGLIVLDHHDYDTPITNGILINNQNKNYNVQRNGSGALVTHKFLQGLDKEFELTYSSDYIDIVALSLIADSMDMTSMENRAYYYYGLENKDCIINPFLKRLVEKLVPYESYTQRDLSWKIIPKLNAVVRSKNQENKKRLFSAFLSNDIAEFDSVIEMCTQAHIDQVNTVNKIIDKNMDKINEIKDNNLIILIDDEIPRSYNGLIAGKVMNLCGNKPTISGSIKDGKLMGSLRSPIPLRTELNENSLVEFARGHEESCGVSLPLENVDALIEEYNNKDINIEPIVNVVKKYNTKNISDKIFRVFDGYDTIWNESTLPKPSFCIENIVFNPSDIRVLGNNKRTIKIETDKFDILIFNVSNKNKEELGLGMVDANNVFVENVSNTKKIMNCLGYLNINVWNGKSRNQVIVNSFEVVNYNKKHKISCELF